MSNSEKPITMNEHLSAMFDDEVGVFEQCRVLDELKTDECLCGKLSTYALIGETLRLGETKNTIPLANQGFLAGIHEKIASEDKFDQVLIEANDNDAKESSSWLRPIGGFAIAASFGALALMGLQNTGILNSPTATPADNIVESSSEIAIVNKQSDHTSATEPKINIAENTQSLTSDNFYVDADARTRSSLKRYVDSHMQYANASAFVPSVRVIAYTDNQ